MEKEKYPPNKKESVKGLFARIKGLTIIAAIILALWSFSGTSCIFRSIIGLPCPACGMTRATIGLMKGNTRIEDLASSSRHLSVVGSDYGDRKSVV